MNRSVQKVITICLILTALLLAGCGQPQTPSDQVAADLDQIREEALSEDMELIFGSADLAEKYTDQYRQLLEKMQEFEYEILGEEIAEDGEHATVQVKITTYDFGAAYEAPREAIVKAAEEGEIDIETDLETYVYDLLFEKLLAVNEKSCVREVTINCTKNSDGDWIAAINSNPELLDAILGGISSAAEKQQEENAAEEDAEDEQESEAA